MHNFIGHCLMFLILAFGIVLLVLLVSVIAAICKKPPTESWRGGK